MPTPDEWNGMRDEATRTGRIQVGGRLSLRNSVTGTVISFDDPVVTLVLAVITGPVLNDDDEPEDGRYLANVILGPVVRDATGAFTATDLGEQQPTTPTVVEAWNLAPGKLDNGRPICGWHVENRTEERDGRQILIIDSGGLPKADAKYQVLTILDDTLTPVWSRMRVQS